MSRIKRKFRILVLVALAAGLMGNLDQSTKDALKVQHLLKTIEAKKPVAGGANNSAKVTENELNAYISYRLTLEKDTLIKHLKVNLLDGNRVRGDLRLNAERLNLSLLAGNNLDFDITGRVITRDGSVRLEREEILLNGYVVQPMILDLVLKAVSIYYGRELGGIDDWYALPKGVNRMTVDKGKVLLFY